MSAPKVVTSSSRSFKSKAIQTIIEHHEKLSKGEVRFIEEMAWKSSVTKQWTGDLTAALFWQEKIPKKPPGCTNWFGLYWKKDYDSNFNLVGQPDLRIFGMEDFDPVIDAVIAHGSNTLIYSRYQHDFFYDPSNTVAIDGGREYTRILGNPGTYTKVAYNLVTRKYKSLSKLVKPRWKNVAAD